MHVLCHRLLLRNIYRQIIIDGKRVIGSRPVTNDVDPSERATEIDMNHDSVAKLKSRLNAACRRLEEVEIGSASFVVWFATGLLEPDYGETRARLEKLVGSKTGRDFSSDLLTSDNLKGLEEYQEPLGYERDSGHSESFPTEESAA